MTLTPTIAQQMFSTNLAVQYALGPARPRPSTQGQIYADRAPSTLFRQSVQPHPFLRHPQQTQQNTSLGSHASPSEAYIDQLRQQIEALQTELRRAEQARHNAHISQQISTPLHTPQPMKPAQLVLKSPSDPISRQRAPWTPSEELILQELLDQNASITKAFGKIARTQDAIKRKWRKVSTPPTLLVIQKADQRQMLQDSHHRHTRKVKADVEQAAAATPIEAQSGVSAGEYFDESEVSLLLASDTLAVRTRARVQQFGTFISESSAAREDDNPQPRKKLCIEPPVEQSEAHSSPDTIIEDTLDDSSPTSHGPVNAQALHYATETEHFVCGKGPASARLTKEAMSARPEDDPTASELTSRSSLGADHHANASEAQRDKQPSSSDDRIGLESVGRVDKLPCLSLPTVDYKVSPTRPYDAVRDAARYNSACRSGGPLSALSGTKPMSI